MALEIMPRETIRLRVKKVNTPADILNPNSNMVNNVMRYSGSLVNSGSASWLSNRA
jgi:hypothetical protein